MSPWKLGRIIIIDIILSLIEVADNGQVMHLKEYGLIKVFKTVATDGDVEYWATNDLQMNELTRVKYGQET